MSTFRYLTVKTWAKEAGVTRAAVYAKIKRGTIKYSDGVEHNSIDTNDYAPRKDWNHNYFEPKIKELPF